MKNYDELIQIAQDELNTFRQLTPTVAQELINALIAVTGDKVFVCNEKEED